MTVTPIIDENIAGGPGKKVSGKIDYINDTLQPLQVVLDTKSFSVSDTGEMSYRALDPDIHLKLSEMSFRIAPRQTYTVFYEVSADKIPAWCVVYAAFSGFKERTKEGFKIQIQLPHTIYVLPKTRLQKSELVVKLAEYHADTKRVVVRVENSGPAFGRVLEADAVSDHGRTTQGGFPVFPGSERQVEFAWDAEGVPTKISLRLDRFSLEQPLVSKP